MSDDAITANLPVRVGKLEVSVASLGSDVNSLRTDFSEHRQEVRTGLSSINSHLSAQDRALSGQGKPNWVALGVMVTITIALGGYLFGRISDAQQEARAGAIAVQAYSDRQHADSLDRLKRDRDDMIDRAKENRDQLMRYIEKEQTRNNELENQMGHVMELNDLFKRGLLKLDGSTSAQK